MSWKDLDIKLKAELIKLGVLSGIRDKNKIIQMYDLSFELPILVRKFEEGGFVNTELEEESQVGLERLIQDYLIQDPTVMFGIKTLEDSYRVSEALRKFELAKLALEQEENAIIEEEVNDFIDKKTFASPKSAVVPIMKSGTLANKNNNEILELLETTLLLLQEDTKNENSNNEENKLNTLVTTEENLLFDWNKGSYIKKNSWELVAEIAKPNIEEYQKSVQERLKKQKDLEEQQRKIQELIRLDSIQKNVLDSITKEQKPNTVEALNNPVEVDKNTIQEVQDIIIPKLKKGTPEYYADSTAKHINRVLDEHFIQNPTLYSLLTDNFNFDEIQKSFIHKEVKNESFRLNTDSSYKDRRQPLEHLHRAIVIHTSGGSKGGDLTSLSGRERAIDRETRKPLYNKDGTPKYRLVGAHFYVSKEGEIYLLVGEDKVAFHSATGQMFDAIDPNSFAFGIELEGYSYDEGGPNEHKNTDFNTRVKQLESLGKLVAYLSNKYNIPRELIQTHYDVREHYVKNFYEDLGYLPGIEGRKDKYGIEWPKGAVKVDIMPKLFEPIKNYLETHVFKKINNEHAFGGYINNQLPVLFRLFKNGGYKDGNDKTKNKENKTYGPYELPAVIITPDSQYNEFLNSLPDNHKYTPEEEYRMYKYWQLWGKPKNFLYTLNNPNEDGDYMFNWDTSDSSYHGSTIAWGDDGVGYFIKPKHHETLKYEFDYFNNGIITEEGGIQRPMTPEEQKEWEEFKSKYTLKDDGNFYKYVPKAKEEYISNNPTLAYSGGGPIKRKRENSLDWRMAVYNAVDPRSTVKNIDDAFRLYNAAVAKEKSGETSKNYTLNNTVGDLTSDAAWRKRLLLPYDETLLPVWNGDTVSLSRPLELEIPVDTNLVKDRINYAQNEFWNDVKSLNLKQLKEDLSYKKSQEELLDALRYTYKTGKPIGVSEYHANSIDPEKVLKDFKYGISPLNVLGRYNIRYDKDENKMYYSDEWDFNLYEWAVPGTTFRIRGAIPLNNKNGGFIFPNLAFSHKFEK